MSATKLNPRIGNFEFGVRTLKCIKIYPLSVGHQLRVSDSISEILTRIFSIKVQEIEKEFVDSILSFFKDNLKMILEFVFDKEEMKNLGFLEFDDFLLDLDNEQVFNLALAIKKQNYDRIIKNLEGPIKGLMENLRSFPLMGPSPESATTIQDTESNISSNLGTVKEE